ncbi:MAG TPA: AraC family transcriptional regulator [Candidatus Sulfotelmatobacter sp.]|nr:AraC family transcriptional regulator [Candidatus Sulfotelmatobacter sp.]
MKPQTAKPSTRKSFANVRAEMKSADPRVRKVVRAIERHEFDSLPELAQLVELSGSRLSHLFKEETGLSLGELLVKQRLERAAHLLRSTKITIGEISRRVGYRHAPSFVRAFKRSFDFSPTVYRIREGLSKKHLGPR